MGLRRLAVALAALAVSACATAKPPPIPAAVRVQCLPMVSYSPAEQAKAADELQALPAGSELARFITDYGAMRAADRACLAVRP